MTRFEEVFRSYETWFTTKHAKQIEEKLGSPLAGLRPVKSLGRSADRVPRDMKVLWTKLGAGKLVASEEWGQSEYHLLKPSEVERERRACASWIGEDAAALAKKNEKVDVAKMIPFVVAPDRTTWVVLAGVAPLDRVFYVSHDWEQREEKRYKLFAGPLTLVAFFEHFFARCRKLDPLNGSYEHRYRFGKRP